MIVLGPLPLLAANGEPVMSDKAPVFWSILNAETFPLVAVFGGGFGAERFATYRCCSLASTAKPVAPAPEKYGDVATGVSTPTENVKALTMPMF